jgi:hypothetical protein
VNRTLSARVWRFASFLLRYGSAVGLGFLLPLVSAVVASKGGIGQAQPAPVAVEGWRDRAAIRVMNALDSGAGVVDV